MHYFKLRKFFFSFIPIFHSHASIDKAKYKMLENMKVGFLSRDEFYIPKKAAILRHSSRNTGHFSNNYGFTLQVLTTGFHPWGTFKTSWCLLPVTYRKYNICIIFLYTATFLKIILRHILNLLYIKGVNKAIYLLNIGQIEQCFQVFLSRELYNQFNSKQYCSDFLSEELEA